MSMSQKLSRFAKTFWSALLTRWQGFSDSDDDDSDDDDDNSAGEDDDGAGFHLIGAAQGKLCYSSGKTTGT